MHKQPAKARERGPQLEPAVPVASQLTPLRRLSRPSAGSELAARCCDDILFVRVVLEEEVVCALLASRPAHDDPVDGNGLGRAEPKAAADGLLLGGHGRDGVILVVQRRIEDDVVARILEVEPRGLEFRWGVGE